jgi:hypothetical protein
MPVSNSIQSSAPPAAATPLSTPSTRDSGEKPGQSASSQSSNYFPNIAAGIGGLALTGLGAAAGVTAQREIKVIEPQLKHLDALVKKQHSLQYAVGTARHAVMTPSFDNPAFNLVEDFETTHGLLKTGIKEKTYAAVTDFDKERRQVLEKYQSGAPIDAESRANLVTKRNNASRLYEAYQLAESQHEALSAIPSGASDKQKQFVRQCSHLQKLVKAAPELETASPLNLYLVRNDYEQALTKHLALARDYNAADKALQDNKQSVHKQMTQFNNTYGKYGESTARGKLATAKEGRGWGLIGAAVGIGMMSVAAVTAWNKAHADDKAD